MEYSLTSVMQLAQTSTPPIGYAANQAEFAAGLERETRSSDLWRMRCE